MSQLFLIAVLLIALAFGFRHLFRTLDFSRLLLIDRRQWRFIRRNKLLPYYVLFVLFVLISVGGAIHHLVGLIEHVRQ